MNPTSKQSWMPDGLKKIMMLVLLISFILSGCAPQAAAVQPTETATQVPTDTPQPTSTATSTATETPTSTPTPTATPDRKATSAAKKTATAEALNEMVRPDLEKLGIDPSEGRVVWADDDQIKLQVSGYQQASFYPLDELGDLGDFVVQSRITWESTGGLAACGFVIRYNAELDNSQYALELVRLQFAPGWMLAYYRYGQFQYLLTGDPVESSRINDENNSENLVTLVARGDEFTVYINGEKERTAYNDRIPAGTFALVTSQESGETTCKFNDSWIFAFDE